MATVTRVLKWEVPVDGETHYIVRGQVVHVACQGGPDTVHVWTLEVGDEAADPATPRPVQVFGTGQPVPLELGHLGSALWSHRFTPLVWHVFEGKVE